MYSIEDLISFGEGNRSNLPIELYIKSLTNLFINGDNRLEKIVNNSIIEIPKYFCDGYYITPCPTFTNKVMRYVTLDDHDKLYFTLKTDDIYYGFVNPTELSYNNIENILSLEKRVKKIHIPGELKIEEIKRGIYKCKLGNNNLLSLDKLNLYLPPFNDNDRGGNGLFLNPQY